MKKKHIFLILILALFLMSITMLFGNLSTYQSIKKAMNNAGKTVSIIGVLDTTYPVEYDAIKNPNYLKFAIKDSSGTNIPVVYHNAMPTDFKKAEKLVLKGKVHEGYFDCKEILMKCPSKYANKGSLNNY